MRGAALGQVGGRPGRPRPQRVLGQQRRGEHRDAAVGHEAPDGARRLDAVEHGHVEVHQDHVGPERARLLDRALAVGGPADDLDAPVGGQRQLESFGEQQVIVSDEDSDRWLRRHALEIPGRGGTLRIRGENPPYGVRFGGKGGGEVRVCAECGGELATAFRFCPWCAAPQRSKLVEFFRGHPRDQGRALRVSRYLSEDPQVRFSVWGPDGVAQAAVSLEDDEAERLADFLSTPGEPRAGAAHACAPEARGGVSTLMRLSMRGFTSRLSTSEAAPSFRCRTSSAATDGGSTKVGSGPAATRSTRSRTTSAARGVGPSRPAQASRARRGCGRRLRPRR